MQSAGHSARQALLSSHRFLSLTPNFYSMLCNSKLMAVFLFKLICHEHSHYAVACVCVQCTQTECSQRRYQISVFVKLVQFDDFLYAYVSLTYILLSWCASASVWLFVWWHKWLLMLTIEDGLTRGVLIEFIAQSLWFSSQTTIIITMKEPYLKKFRSTIRPSNYTKIRKFELTPTILDGSRTNARLIGDLTTYL